jgi:KDO2-lipid IV(A) lauroyltransferase
MKLEAQLSLFAASIFNGVCSQVDLVAKRFDPQRISCLQLINVSLFPLWIFLPAPLAYGIAVLRGDLHYRYGKLYSEVDRSYFSREEIISTLKRVFGDQLSQEERSRVTRDFFRLRCCEIVDAMRFGRGRAFGRLVEIRGLNHIEAALTAGKGVILCSAHFGSNYACYSLLGSLGLPITHIASFSYDDDRVSPTQRFFNALIRNRLVVHLLQPGKRQAAILLRQNELISTMLDAHGGPEEDTRRITVDFLNGKASLLPGAIKIAQLTGARVLMMFMRRSSDWRHQVLEISAPMSMEGDIVTVFRRCFAIVEAAIRRDPAHWRRWTNTDLIVGEKAWRRWSTVT